MNAKVETYIIPDNHSNSDQDKTNVTTVPLEHTTLNLLMEHIAPQTVPEPGHRHIVSNTTIFKQISANEE